MELSVKKTNDFVLQIDNYSECAIYFLFFFAVQSFFFLFKIISIVLPYYSSVTAMASSRYSYDFPFE